MKKTLLSLSALALGVAFSATAEERYYIIKDGALAEGIEQVPYQPLEEAGAYDTIISGETFDDVAVASYYHGTEKYKDVRLNLSAAPLDLSKTWVLKMKYRLPYAADSANYNTYQALNDCSAHDGTKPAFFFGLSTEADSMALNTMDYMFNIQAGYESIHNGGDWIEKDLYLTVPKFLKTASSMVIGYGREAVADITGEPAYIAEMYFYEAGVFPFFAEDFSPRMSNVWSDAGKLSDEELEWKSGAKFDSGKPKVVKSGRVWNKPWDDSEIPATEIAHAVSLAQSATFFTINDIELPAGATSINVHSLVKSDVTDKNQDAWDALGETPEGRPVSVLAIFDNGTETPVYPEAVRMSQWMWYSSEVQVPAGAKTVTLKYISEDCVVALLVNQVMVSQGAIDLSKYFPKATLNDVEDVIATAGAKANVYVADGVVVAEGASKVEVVALSGALVATANAGSVNISGLADGIYVVRAYTAEGVAAAIIKK